ncbi:MAG TPA: DUF4178 domain-containing protein [Gemmatimonadaceae bacterium]|nr:DUF4178 domain-containing protein [Gemmatimonadaceae bacterium]
MSAPAVSSLSCPQCGAAITLRTLDQAQSVVCSSCGSILDARDPNLHVLQAFEAKQKFTPQIPLGTRGALKGEKWEVVGYQVRRITIDGTSYYWEEYLLFNPYKGFRYLTQYDGHWNDVQIVKAAPAESINGRQPFVTLYGETFKHFQTATAYTEFVLGEFPWQVRVGDHAVVRDFVAPPRMLSEESTPDETTWSLGTYTPAAQIWKAFSLPGKPLRPRGVYANQPDEYRPVAGSMAKRYLLFAAIIVGLGVLRFVTAARETVFATDSSFFRPGAPADSLAFVTPTFTVKGRTTDLEVTTEAQVDNGWAYFDYALVNEQTGTTYEFGREVSYYYGRDSDGAWSEGSRRDRALLPSVPAGQYFLRVLPEAQVPTDFLEYRIVVRRDVPIVTPYLVCLALLAIPPIFWALRAWGMESARWKESDYAPDDDDDDE